MHELRVEGLTVEAGGRRIVDAADFTLAPGELVVLLGPNGSGKSSLLRAALGLSPMAGGSATLMCEAVHRLSPRHRARALAYLPQVRPLAWPQRVRDVVALGRFAHGIAPGRLGAEDAAAIERAMADAELGALADRATDTLSGGELARVHLARALAASAPLIVADEPVAALDPRHQHRVMQVLSAFVGRGGGALVVLHDLDIAARYADRLLWMKDARIAAAGSVAETMTVERIADIYGVDARVALLDGRPQVIVTGAR